MSSLKRVSEGVVTRLVLSRPDRANALDAELVEALISAVEGTYSDGTRLLVIEGVGHSFCGGLDLSTLDSDSDGDLVLRLIRIETLLQAVYHLPVLTLALAHGRVFGAGADLFASCHWRIASPDASFRMPGLRFGVLLGTRRLVARVGSDRAQRLQIETGTIAASESLEMGFATAIRDRQDWPEVAASALHVATTLDPEASAALFGATACNTRDLDLADLARTASRPGLADRIRAYREGMLRDGRKKNSKR